MNETLKNQFRELFQGERPPGQADTVNYINIPRPLQFYLLSFIHDWPLYMKSSFTDTEE